jgi:hypothetical protein
MPVIATSSFVIRVNPDGDRDAPACIPCSQRARIEKKKKSNARGDGSIENRAGDSAACGRGAAFMPGQRRQGRRPRALGYQNRV